MTLYKPNQMYLCKQNQFDTIFGHGTKGVLYKILCRLVNFGPVVSNKVLLESPRWDLCV